MPIPARSVESTQLIRGILPPSPVYHITILFTRWAAPTVFSVIRSAQFSPAGATDSAFLSVGFSVQDEPTVNQRQIDRATTPFASEILLAKSYP